MKTRKCTQANCFTRTSTITYTLASTHAFTRTLKNARSITLSIENIHHQPCHCADIFDRFKKLGVIASMQPYHLIDDGRWASALLGPTRTRTAYPFRTLLDRYL